MLNDLSRFTRTSVALQMLGPGFAAGALVRALVVPLDPEIDAAVLILLGIALALIPAWAVWHGVMLRRMERRLWEEVVTGSEELVSGGVAATPLPARVVRSRPKRALPAFGLAHGRQDGGAAALSATVVGDGVPRRVGMLVPAGLALPAGAPLLVAVHPDRAEVAVLEDRIGPADVASSVEDPRWQQPLPTDRTVVGGWLPIVGAAALGLLAGFGLGFAGAAVLVG